MTHYGYLRTLLNVNATPTSKEITLALDEQAARIAELERENKILKAVERLKKENEGRQSVNCVARKRKG